MAITFGDLLLFLRADTSQAERAQEDFARKSEETAAHAGGFWEHVFAHTVGEAIERVFERAIEFVSEAARAWVDHALKFDELNHRFAAYLGSLEEGKKRVEELQQIRNLGPWLDLEDIARADMLLQSFGLRSEEAARQFGFSGRQILEIAANVATATGESTEQVVMILTNMLNGNAQRALQMLQRLGIGSKAELDRMGLVFSEAGQLLSPLPEAIHGVLTLMQEKFGGAMEAQRHSLKGMLAGIKNFVEEAGALLLTPIFERFQEQLYKLYEFLLSDEVEAAVDHFVDTVGEIADFFGDLFGAAYEWGSGIVQAFAEGISGAVGWIEDALQPIAETISYWLMPGSPPRLLPDLTRWGKGAATEYMKGWAEADFDAFDKLANQVEQAITALVRAGGIPEVELIPRVLGSREAISEIIAQLRETGTVTEEVMGRLRAAMGPAADEADRLVQAMAEQMRQARLVAEAEAQVAEAEEALKRVREEVEGPTSEVARLQGELKGITERLTAAQREQREAQDRVAAAQRDLAEATRRVKEAQADLNRVTAEYEEQLAPLQGQLDGVRQQMEQLRRAKRAAELQKVISDASASDYEREMARLELLELQLQDQIDLKREEQKQAEAAARQRLLAAEAEERAHQALVEQSQQEVEGINQRIAEIKREQEAKQAELEAAKEAARVKIEAAEKELEAKREALRAAQEAQRAALSEIQAAERVAEMRRKDMELVQRQRELLQRIEEQREREAERAARAAERAQAALEKRGKATDEAAQAELKYRLATASTTEKIAILREELSKTTKGSKEYWEIMTQIAQLEERSAKEGLKMGEALSKRPPLVKPEETAQVEAQGSAIERLAGRFPVLGQVMGFVRERAEVVKAVLVGLAGTALMGLAQAALPAVAGALVGLVGSLGAFASAVLLPAGAIGALYLAFQSNFGGIRDTVLSVLGIVGEAWANLWPQIAQTFGQVVGIVSQTIAAARPMVAEILNGIGQALERVRPVLEGFAAFVGQMVSDLVSVALPIVRGAAEFIGEQVLRIVGFFQENMPLIQGAVQVLVRVATALLQGLQAVWGAVFPVLAAVATGAFEAVKAAIATVVNTILGIVRAFLLALNGDWSGAWRQIQAVLQGVLDGLLRIVIGFLDGFLGRWGLSLQGLWGMVTGWANDVATAIERFCDGVAGRIEAWLSGIAESFSTSWSGIRDFLQGLWERLAEWLGDAWDNLYEALLDWLGDVRRSWEKAWGDARDFLHTTWEAIKGNVTEALGAVWRAISGKVTELYEAVTKPYRDAWDYLFGPTGLWPRLLAEVGSRLETVRQAIFGAAGNLLEALKKPYQDVWEFLFGAEGLFKRIIRAITGSDAGSFVEQLKSHFANVSGSIVSALTAPFDAVERYIGTLWERVKGLFKLPHIRISWEDTDIPGVRLPKFNIEWYARGLDAIFSAPTLIGVGEAGPERVIVQPLGARREEAVAEKTVQHIYHLYASFLKPETPTSLRDLLRALEMGVG